jgi:outer membrane protein assembly factor BamB
MLPRSRKARVLVGLLVAAIVLTAAALAFLLGARNPGDVSNPDVAFETTATPKPAPKPGAANFRWPFYGYDAARTHNYPLARPLRPTKKVRWSLRGSVLLEFTPVADGDSLLLLKNNASLYALKRQTGVVYWKKKLGDLAASSPAYVDGIAYCTILAGTRGSKKGRIVAVDPKKKKILWSKNLASRTESSPFVRNGVVYFGSENGTVYALRAKDGKVLWTYKASGAVKGGLAYANGKLFFGDYAGTVHGISAKNGKALWTSGGGGALGLGGGQFYGTASVAFGRVYIGNTNSSVYSFSTSNGEMAWRQGTGGYVYSSAAVADIPKLGPTVYIGSYDGNLYALNAKSGAIRWSKPTGGRISGGIQIIGDLVFYSTLEKKTAALSVRNGRTIWSVPKGQFNPAIFDGKLLVVMGMTSMFAYETKSVGKANSAPTAAK